MTILGVILFVGGIAAFGLILTGNAPDQLAALPMPVWVWIAVAFVGLVLIMLNRRPAN